MFEPFYELAHSPFSRDIPTDELYASTIMEETLGRLEYAAKRQWFAVITGDCGTGKTTTIRRFAEMLDESKFKVLYLSDSKLTPRHFYKGLLEQLGCESKFYRGDAKRQLHREIELMRGIHQLQPVVVVDEAHLLDREMLEEVRFLLNFKMDAQSPMAELIPQFNLVKEVTTSFGIKNIGVAGWEADDCIGTLSRHFAKEAEVLVLTGDHDMLQLIEDQVKIVIMKKGQSNYAVYDEALLKEEKGLTPRQVIDMKGLMGDTADNYPGVKGIGEKTALKLLQEFESIEGILENLEQLPKGVRSKIEAELDMLHLSRDLAEIRCDAPVSCELSECKWAPQPEPIRQKFEELEFKGLMKLIS